MEGDRQEGAGNTVESMGYLAEGREYHPPGRGSSKQEGESDRVVWEEGPEGGSVPEEVRLRPIGRQKA